MPVDDSISPDNLPDNPADAPEESVETLNDAIETVGDVVDSLIEPEIDPVVETATSGDSTIAEVIIEDEADATSIAPSLPEEILPSEPTVTLKVTSRSSWTTRILLALILLAAGYVRFRGIEWDSNTHVHPDERFLTMVEASIEPVETFGQYFDTALSPLNPANRGHTFFVYGTAPIFIVRYTAEALNVTRATLAVAESGWQADLYQRLFGPEADTLIARFGTGYNGVHLVGRWLSALFDLMTVWLLFFVARRLYDDRVGLLSSAFYAFAVSPIQQAHFWTVDSFATTFVVAALYFAARTLDEHRWRNYVLFGIFLGLSVGSRINVAPLGLAVALGALVFVWRYYRLAPYSARFTRQMWTGIVGVGLAAFISLLVFRIVQPYTFEGPSFFNFLPSENWMNSMTSISHQMSGEVDFPPNHQWANRAPYLFPLENMIKWGMGWALGLAAWTAFVWALLRMASGRWERHLIPVVWTGLYFGWLGQQWVKPIRYFLPIYPTLIMLAAWALITLWDMSRKREPIDTRTDVGFPNVLAGKLLTAETRIAEFMANNLVMRPLTMLLLVGVLVGNTAWGYAFSTIYTRAHPLVAATDWLYANAPGPINLKISTDDGLTSQPVPLPTDFQVEDDAIYSAPFVAQQSGVLNAVTFGFVGELAPDPEDETLNIQIAKRGDTLNILAETEITRDLVTTADRRGVPNLELVLPFPIEITEGDSYVVMIRSEHGPFRITGSNMINETPWDLSLPLRTGGFDPFNANQRIYGDNVLEMYWEDNEDKRLNMFNALENGDYIVISTNRQYGSLARIPARFPMSLRYYDALFSGELGFDLVAEFENAPALGPWVRSDQAAEEPFTVYDHPKALVFQKTDRYSSSNTLQILRSVDLSGVVHQNAFDATAAPYGLQLPELAENEAETAGTWISAFPQNNPLNRFNGLAVIGWWLAASLLGWIAFPILFATLTGLPGRGYALARTAGLLLVAWGSWWLTQLPLIEFSALSGWLATLIMVAIALLLGFQNATKIVKWGRQKALYLATVEGAGLLLFLFFLFVRWQNPDLWHPSYGGEKPMDFAYFNSVLRSASFPPADPWFAGGYINYYYFGFVLVGVLTEMLGLEPAIAYNLALPLLFALTGLGGLGLAYNLTAALTQPRSSADPVEEGANNPEVQPIFAGLVTAALMVLLGNLGQMRTFIDGLQRVAPDVQGAVPVLTSIQQSAVGFWRVVVQGTRIPTGTGSWYWNATRIIPATAGEAQPITEFPLFTFLYADLHAHLIALPLTLMALAWAVSTALDRRRKRGVLGTGMYWVLGGVSIGVLSVTNTWDYPTYLLFGVLGSVFLVWRKHRILLDFEPLFEIIWRAGLLYLLAKVLFQPFHSWYGLGYTSVERWQGSYTPLTSYVQIHGLFLFICITFLFVEAKRWLQSVRVSEIQAIWTNFSWTTVQVWGIVYSLSILLVMTILFLSGVQVAVIVIPLLLVTALLALVPFQHPVRRVVLTMFAAGLALTLMVELITLSGDIGRMNTVFKFYLQVWTLFSIVSGVALAWILSQLTKWDAFGAAAWRTVLTLLFAFAALYTVTAVPAKMRDRISSAAPNTLDGMEYMQTATYADQTQTMTLKYDHDAIEWLQRNVSGSPTILEAQAPEYRWGSRYSIYTGLPTVLGWNWHQRQQRTLTPETLIWNRATDIQKFYDSTNPAEKLEIIQKYDVSYVIAGEYERAYYNASGIGTLDTMVEQNILEVAYQNEGVKIYRVLIPALN